MATDWTYPVELRREGGEVHAYCDGLPEAIAAGATEGDALHEMREALAAALHGRIKVGMDLEPPRAVRAGEHGRSPTEPPRGQGVALCRLETERNEQGRARGEDGPGRV